MKIEQFESIVEDSVLFFKLGYFASHIWGLKFLSHMYIDA